MAELENQNTNVGGDGENTGSGEDAGQTGGSNGTENAGTEKRFTQVEMDALAAKVRDQEKRKHENKLNQEREEATRKAAEAQGEFQKLYEAEKVKAAELETRAQAAERYAERINQVLDGEVKDWPAEVKQTDPGAENLDDRLRWVETHRDLAKRLASAGAAPNPEHGRQGRTFKPGDITDNYLKSQYSRPGAS